MRLITRSMFAFSTSFLSRLFPSVNRYLKAGFVASKRLIELMSNRTRHTAQCASLSFDSTNSCCASFRSWVRSSFRRKASVCFIGFPVPRSLLSYVYWRHQSRTQVIGCGMPRKRTNREQQHREVAAVAASCFRIAVSTLVISAALVLL